MRARSRFAPVEFRVLRGSRRGSGVVGKQGGEPMGVAESDFEPEVAGWRMRCAYPPYGAGDRHRRVPRQFTTPEPEVPGGRCAALIRPTALVTAIDEYLANSRHQNQRWPGGGCAALIRPTALVTAIDEYLANSRHQNQRWPGGGCAALIRPTALVTAIDDALSFRSFSSKSYGGICALHIVPTDLLT